MAQIKINALDHIVLNVADIARSLRFYTEILGLKPERLEEFKAGKVSFPSVRIDAATIIDLFPVKSASTNDRDGSTKRNLNHFCLVVEREDFSGALEVLKQNQVAIREGPVSRWGARGQATSIYFPDPDGNEIEIRCY
jgi:catechol 2,3-dioxygenase-like lactoylglutathione lyase family enzyme